jgi:hypothetical protein
MRLSRVILVSAIVLAGCDLEDLTGDGADRYDPTNLTYRLLPSGDPDTPLGVLLEWTPPTSSDVVSFDVFGRSSTSGEWILRATTTSPSFHDAGVPQLQYYVTSNDEDGDVLGESGFVEIDEFRRLPAPDSLRSITLNSAIQLSWAANAHREDPEEFDHYRVYSSAYVASTNRCTEGSWRLEGTTVSDAFLSANMENGVSRCFAVSAVSRDGHESLWSAARLDTPRPDARHVLVDAVESRPLSSGFLFFEPSSAKFGVIADGTRSDLDFRVERRTDGSLWFRLIRPEGRVAVFGTAPIPSLTDIDRAAGVEFLAGSVEALSGWGYVFSVRQADGTHYAAVRVSYVDRDYVVLDWAYQTAPGNPELLRADVQ